MHCPQSYTLRQDLSHTSTERKCTRDKCPISNTGLCLRRNAVYQLTCNICDQQYIGTREIILSWLLTRHASSMHDRVNEHLNNENSSLKKKIYSCQNKDYECIEVKIIMSETTPLIYAFMKHF